MQRGYTRGVPPAVKESPRTRSEGFSAVLFPISVRTEIGCPCGGSTSKLSKVQNYKPALAENKSLASTARVQQNLLCYAHLYTKLVYPIKYSSISLAAALPSAIAHTTSDCPLWLSPAVKSLSTLVL